MFKELYEAINQADEVSSSQMGTGSLAFKSFAQVNADLSKILDQFKNLYYASEDYVTADDANYKNDAVRYYNGIAQHIIGLTKGGEKYSVRWTPGYYYYPPAPETSSEPSSDPTPEPQPIWRSGTWSGNSTAVGLIPHIEQAKQEAIDFMAKFERVLELSIKIDEKRSQILTQIEELEKKLEQGKCSDDLKASLTEKKNVGGKLMSEIDLLKECAEKKWGGIGSAYRDQGINFLEKDYIADVLDQIEYRSKTSASSIKISLYGLSNIGSTLSISNNSRIKTLAGYSDVGYSFPKTFKLYKDMSDEHKEAYEYLKSVCEGHAIKLTELIGNESDPKESGDGGEKQQRDIINNITRLFSEIVSGLTNDPEGALELEDSAFEEFNPDFIQMIKNIGAAFSNDLLGLFDDPYSVLANGVDYSLIMIYDWSMFSNYTTARVKNAGLNPGDDGFEYEKSIAGIPLSPRVNYFYQSELEFLYKGSQSAKTNLSAVTELIFFIRLICNYIVVFTIPEISNIVQAIRTAFAPVPVVGVVLGELARSAFAVAETLVDVASLRSGYSVPFVKKKSDWIVQPATITKLSGVIADGRGLELWQDTNSIKLSYETYLLIGFLKNLMTQGGFEAASNVLAERTSQLIEWNIVNYKNAIGPLPRKDRPVNMKAALRLEDRFKMSDYDTAVEIKLSGAVRMMFLSMPYAQNSGIGVIPPGYKILSAADIRGY